MGGKSRLTLQQVERIQAELAKPKAKKADVAKKFGLSLLTIGKMDKVRRDSGERIDVKAVKKII
jgi:hypothetical protein